MSAAPGIEGGTQKTAESGTRTIESIAEDQIWIYENCESLAAEYNQKVIGVLNAKVVAAAQSFGHLKEKVVSMGLKPSHIVASFMSSDADRMEKFLVTRDAKIEVLRNADYFS